MIKFKESKDGKFEPKLECYKCLKYIECLEFKNTVCTNKLDPGLPEGPHIKLEKLK
jgi:hypothetical protein